MTTTKDQKMQTTQSFVYQLDLISDPRICLKQFPLNDYNKGPENTNYTIICFDQLDLIRAPHKCLKHNPLNDRNKGPENTNYTIMKWIEPIWWPHKALTPAVVVSLINVQFQVRVYRFCHENLKFPENPEVAHRVFRKFFYKLP